MDITYEQFITYMQQYIETYEDKGDPGFKGSVEEFCDDVAKFINAVRGMKNELSRF